MAITFSQHIAAPIERVFACVDDDSNQRAWMDGLVEMIYPDGSNAEKRAGTKFRQRLREGGRVVEYEGEVTAYERPRRLGMRIGNAMFSVQVDYRFSTEGGGTRLDYRAGIATHNWFAKAMGFLFGWLTRRILRKQMAKLKALAESGTE